jgi:flagellar hook-length control protein FliK
MKDESALVAEAEQGMKDESALVAEAEQGMKDMLPVNDAPVQTDASLANGDLDKEAKNKDREQDQVAPAEDIGVQEEPAAAIVLPSVVLTEQAKTDNKAAQDDAAKEKVLSSFVKPFTFTEGVKLSLSQQKDEVSGDGSKQEADVHQSTQDKQNFNLKFFENAGQMGKTGQIEHQPLGLEADKVASRAAGDIAQLNRPIADNKVDVPALAKPLSHPEWNKDLGDRIVWMNNRAIPTAEIKMNPQHLGPISVRIDVNQDHQANIVFTAQHAVVREAIEASIPKLREMMGAQQLDLVNVNISQNSTSGQGQPQSFAQMADGGSRGKSAEGVIADGISDAMEDVENGQAVVSKGLLSIYA